MGPAAELQGVRPARRSDAEEIARVHALAWRETYAGVLPATTLGPQSVGRRPRLWRRLLARPRQGGATWVAESGGEIVGFGDCGPQREDDRLADGEIYALYLVREAQGRGYGRRLMTAMAGTLLEAGCGSMDVWALDANRRALGFYVALGGRLEASRRISIGGRRLIERALVWSDLAAAFPAAPPRG